MIELRNWCGPQISFDCTIVTCNLCGLWCKPGCVIETDAPGPRLKAIKGKERHVQSYDCYPARCRITRGSAAATLFRRVRAAVERIREGCQTKKGPSAGQLAARERQTKCAAEWKETKAAGKTEKGTTWPKFWSDCNRRLKAAAK